MPEPRLPDQQLSFALRLLSDARRNADLSRAHRAETLVISLLLPRAIATARELLSHGVGVEVERRTAARLTRAVLTWDPGEIPTAASVAALVRQAVGETGAADYGRASTRGAPPPKATLDLTPRP